MEACAGSHWRARESVEAGQDARIIPAKSVTSNKVKSNKVKSNNVKSNKSDPTDAEAIAEAVTRPTMRFVQVRSEAQIDLQALHRIRDRLVATVRGS